MEFKKWEKIKIEYLIILLLTVFLYFNLTRFINNNTNKEVTSATILPKGFIEFGVFDENNEIIDNGSFIDTTNSNLITELQIGQHLDNEREYLLLIFKDYIQSEFKVNNIKHSKKLYNSIILQKVYK